MPNAARHTGAERLDRERRAPPAAAALGAPVAVVGILVIIGWWSQLDGLTRISDRFTPMKPNAALGLVVAGGSLAVWAGRPTGRRVASVPTAAGAVLLLLGVGTLAEFGFGVDLGIDRLLLPRAGDTDAANAGRMAVMSAAVFVALGAGQLALVRRRWRIVHLASAASVVIGYVALLGYLYGKSALYQVGAYSEMSLHMAAAACLLGVTLELCAGDHGIAALVRDRGAAGRITRTLVPTLTALIPLIGWAVLRGERAGMYESPFTAAVIAATIGVLGSALTLWAAAAARRGDELQRAARAELEALTQSLERRVAQRTAEVGHVARDLSAVFDAAPVGMVRLDAAGSCFRVNAEWRRMTGLSDADCTGAGWLDALHPGDRAEVAQAVAAGRPTEQTRRLLTRTGPRTSMCAMRAVDADDPDRAGYIVTVADVHEQTEALRALHDAQARIAAAFHASSLGLALVRLDGTVLEANERLAIMTGRPAHKIVGGPLSDLLTAEYAAAEADVRTSLLAGDRPVGRFACQLAGRPGLTTWVMAHVALVDPGSDGTAYFVAELEDVTASRLAEERLAHAALHDPLTGLPNRLLLLDRLRHALRRSQRLGESVAVLFIDIDRFKSVNDRLGHHAGDDVLRVVAERVAKAARPTDTVSRLGGDEFVVVCEELPSADDALRVAERCRRAISERLVHDGISISVDASIGVAISQETSIDPEALVRDADAAMYEAKARGRGRCVRFDQGMRARLTKWIDAESALIGAVERGELAVLYQPVVAVASGRLVGAESLARWRRAERPEVMPAEFITMAEETGLIVQIGDHVLRTACRDAAIAGCGPRGLRVSVNVSARQLIAADFADKVADVLRLTGLPPAALCLELSVSVLIEAAAAAASVQKLRELGVRLALDDFGIGYSSLSYLRRFPVDVLKVDRAFIVDLPSSARDASIVSGIVQLGRSIGVDVVVEGVERDDQLAALIELGCEFAQGLAFGAPAPADQVFDPGWSPLRPAPAAGNGADH